MRTGKKASETPGFFRWKRAKVRKSQTPGYVTTQLYLQFVVNQWNRQKKQSRQIVLANMPNKYRFRGTQADIAEQRAVVRKIEARVQVDAKMPELTPRERVTLIRVLLLSLREVAKGHPRVDETHVLDDSTRPVIMDPRGVRSQKVKYTRKMRDRVNAQKQLQRLARHGIS